MTTTNNFTDKISNEETAALPAIEFKGEIRIIEHERDIVPACKFLMKQAVVGFDTETRPSFRPGISYRVSLLQLSTPQLCFLFRLNKIPLAKPILQVLETDSILKIGADVALAAPDPPLPRRRIRGPAVHRPRMGHRGQEPA